MKEKKISRLPIFLLLLCMMIKPDLTTQAADSSLPQIGLSGHLFCTGEEENASNVALRWDCTAENIDHYSVFYTTKAGQPIDTSLTDTTQTLYLHYNLTLNQTVSYQVKAVDANGGIIATSNTVSLTPKAVSTDLKLHSNQTGGDLSYATGGTKVGDTYYSYSFKSDGNAKSLIEKTSKTGKDFSNDRVVADKNDNADLGECKLESVQMRYIEKVNKMIIWAHWEKPSGYNDGKAVIITGTPGGDFTVHAIERPLGIYVRDMTIFIDDDGTGYLAAAANEEGQSANATIYLFQMNDTYSGVTRVVNKILENQYREFPCMTKRDGFYYLFTSQTAGWYPSRGGYVVTKDLAGSWSSLRDIGNTSTFSSQSGWIESFGPEEHQSSVLHAYRWLKAEGTSGTTLCPLYFANGFAFYDYYPTLRYDTATGELYPVEYGTLASQNAVCTSSLPAKDGHGADKAFDGNYQSSFEASKSKWPFYLQTDLGQVYDLTNVQTSWFLYKGSEAYYTYRIEGSTDGKNWTTLLDRTDKDADIVKNTYGFTSDLISGSARYVRLTVTNAYLHNNTNNWYTPTVYECKVFGTPTSKNNSSATPDGNYSFSEVSGNTVSGGENAPKLTLYGSAKISSDPKANSDSQNRGDVLSLDGSDNTYAAFDDGTLDGLNDFTISMDVLPQQENATNFFTFALAKDDQKYLLLKASTDKLRYAITSDTWKGEKGAKLDVNSQDTWHQITLVVNGATLRFYCDGDCISTVQADTLLSDLGSGLHAYFGKSPYSEDSYFKGYIDNIRIYRYALSPSQVLPPEQSVEHNCTYEKWDSDDDAHFHTCSICGKILDRTAHSFRKTVTEREATCDTDGLQTQECAVCGHITKTVLPATGHTPQKEWKSDDDNHWHICETCNKICDKEAHDWEWIVDKEATETSEGLRHQVCKVCKAEGKTETIPELTPSKPSVSASKPEEPSKDSSLPEETPSSNPSKPEGTPSADPSKPEETPSADPSRPEETPSSTPSVPLSPSTPSGVPSIPLSPSTPSQVPSAPEIPSGPSSSSSVSVAPSVPSRVSSSEAPSIPSRGSSASEVPSVPSRVSSTSEASSVPSRVSSASEASSIPSRVSSASEAPSVPSRDSSVSVAPSIPSRVSSVPEEPSAPSLVPSIPQNPSMPSLDPSLPENPSTPSLAPSVPGGSSGSDAHTHSEEKNWQYDSDHHWHNCETCKQALQLSAHEMGDWNILRKATCTTAGLKCRNCKICGYSQTQEIPATGHTYKTVIDQKATYDEKGLQHQVCTNCGHEKDYTDIAKKQLAKNSKQTVKLGTSSIVVKVTNNRTDGKGTVTYLQHKNKKTNTVTIPGTVTIHNSRYRVTAIDAHAFAKNKYLTKISIGNYVTKIPDAAFQNCPKLSRVVIGKQVTSIGKKAFYGDSSLKSVTIRSTVLKSVGNNAIKGIHKKAKLYVPSKKKKSIQTLFSKKTGFIKTMTIQSL